MGGSVAPADGSDKPALAAEWLKNDSAFFDEWQSLLRRLIG